MNFIWPKGGYEKNMHVSFMLTLDTPCEVLTVCAVDFYRIFLDGKFVSYGPERCAAGYTRPRSISVGGAKNVRIDVVAYNSPCTSCELQSPFFGAEVLKEGKVIFTTDDFTAYIDNSIVRNAPKYVAQRGYMEIYDFHHEGMTSVETEYVKSPSVVDSYGDVCKYENAEFTYLSDGEFKGFSKVCEVGWDNIPAHTPAPTDFDIIKEFVEKTKSGYKYCDYKLEKEYTGFIALDIDAASDFEIFAVFEETLIEGEWAYRRTAGQDVVILKAPAGKRYFLSCEPYAVKLLKIIYNGDVKFTPSFIKLENSEAECVKVDGGERFNRVFEAARNTFKQNALDIFMDCPGRERAGWLCDSFFTAKAELFFTGKNTIEHKFLENYVLSNPDYLPFGMLPMCYPATHQDGRYIPNWAMWYVVELCDYMKRSGDMELVNKAREKVYGVLRFLEKYENEYGLLEDLESWVFVEWSISNRKDYVCGVNFPSNMLYAGMLDAIYEMYSDEELRTRAENIRKNVWTLSYRDGFFRDNATRNEKGELSLYIDHVSETCQYYALFFGFINDKDFKEKMKRDFGPLRQQGTYDYVGRSNMFIGNYLRFLWLIEEKEYTRVIKETLEYFDRMAVDTGTLWESDSSFYSSRNHGFASLAAMLLMSATTGYMTTKDKKPIFDESFINESGITVKYEFNY